LRVGQDGVLALYTRNPAKQTGFLLASRKTDTGVATPALNPKLDRVFLAYGEAPGGLVRGFSGSFGGNQ
jgi:hypothetical protein